ncbi:DUF2232 domain-containing protein [Heliobacillus mobilis]|uniref:DUF2232 domain-containing protein n=1 Tax=Heliobacterium mobile TaxID=28064 RepID=A0A6I3SPA1_HELMO|nr:YybS family protein [Heliobacterium mobile]MTV50880.1 DUF2232 domain-containing protein [Heliobacterium mobile]
MPIRGLMEGAMLSALTAVLALLGIYIVPLSLITNLVWTIPIVVAIVRHGWKIGIMCLGAATVLIALFAGLPAAIIMALHFGGLAILYGIAFRHSWSTFKSVGLGTFVVLISTISVFYVLMLLAGLTPESFQQELGNAVNYAIESYRSAGLLELYAEQGITEEALRNQFNSWIQMFRNTLPSLVVMASLLAASTNLFLARLILKRLQLPVTTLPAFREWRLPWETVWVVNVGLAAALAGDYWGISWLYLLGINVLYVIMPILLVLGFSVISYALDKFTLSPFLLFVLAVTILLYLQHILVLIMVFGLFDLIFDYRSKMDKFTSA